VVLVATVNTVFKGFKGASKTWSWYWPSPAFRRRSGDTGSGDMFMLSEGWLRLGSGTGGRGLIGGLGVGELEVGFG
jgi:hypothetical protein